MRIPIIRIFMTLISFTNCICSFQWWPLQVTKRFFRVPKILNILKNGHFFEFKTIYSLLLIWSLLFKEFLRYFWWYLSHYINLIGFTFAWSFRSTVILTWRGGAGAGAKCLHIVRINLQIKSVIFTKILKEFNIMCIQ